MKVLVLTSRFPYPPVGGDKLRSYNIIRHLAVRFEVDVFSLYWHDDEARAVPDLEKVCRKVHVHKLSRTKRFWNTALGWLRGLPLQTAYYTDGSARRKIENLLREGAYDVVVVHLVRMLDYVRHLPPECVVLELTDAISLNYRRITRPRSPRKLLYVFERGRLLRYEIAALSRVAAGVLVGDVDAGFLVERGAPAQHIRVIRNGTDLAGTSRSGPHRPARILFLGNMRTTQNEDMAVWFAEEIFPLVRRARPDAEFVIAGANPSPRVTALQEQVGIVVTGPVRDAAETLGTACVTVCPMRYGAGLQNKILESMAVGVPVVSTQAGAEGLGVTPGHEILVADGVVAFAEAVLRVLSDETLRESLGARGAEFVARHFRWEDQMEKYAELVRTAGARSVPE